MSTVAAVAAGSAELFIRSHCNLRDGVHGSVRTRAVERVVGMLQGVHGLSLHCASAPAFWQVQHML